MLYQFALGSTLALHTMLQLTCALAKALKLFINYPKDRRPLWFDQVQPLIPLTSLCWVFQSPHSIVSVQLTLNWYKFMVVFLNIYHECDIPPSLTLFHYFFTVKLDTTIENQGFVVVSSWKGYYFISKHLSSHKD